MRLYHGCGADLAYTHEGSTTHQNCAAWHTLGDKQHECETCGYFDGTEDGSEEKIRVAFVADEQFEVLRTVVCKGGRSSSLLRRENSDCSACALEIFSNGDQFYQEWLVGTAKWDTYPHTF